MVNLILRKAFPTCGCVSGVALSVLSGNLMDAIIGHVTLLGWYVKVTGIVCRGGVKNVLLGFLRTTGLFAVYN